MNQQWSASPEEAGEPHMLAHPPHQDVSKKMMSHVNECGSNHEESERDGNEDLQADEEEDEEEGEEEEEEEDDDLRIAARAGIRLLEENLHFREEVLRLQEQIMHLESARQGVDRVLEEKGTQIVRLTEHLREAIRENQTIITELNLANEQLREQQERVRELQRSPSQTMVGQVLSPGGWLSREQRSFTLEKRRDDGGTKDATCEETASPDLHPLHELPSPRGAVTSPVQGNGAALCTNQTSGSVPCSPTGSASPRRRHALSMLREMESKYDDEHQKNRSLRLELACAQRTVSELRPLQGYLRDARCEVETLRAQVSDLDTQLAQVKEERREEAELIQSLQQTIELYQRLEGQQNDEEKESEGQLAESLGALESIEITPNTHTSEATATVAQSCETLLQRRMSNLEQLEHASDMISGRFHLREENTRLMQQLTTLTEQVLALKVHENITLKSIAQADAGSSQRSGMGKESDASIVIGPVGLGSCTRQRYLQQQVSVLQSLLKRFRFEWKLAHDTCANLENEKTDLLKQIDRLHARVKVQVSRGVTSDKDGRNQLEQSVETLSESPSAEEQPDSIYAEIIRQVSSPRASASKEDTIETEQLCFALLRRLIDSWTMDKPKRMQLHDWLINAIRGTGIRKPLYLHELSSEISAGFQNLMIPILRDRFGAEIAVEKRLRNVIVTDLRIQVESADHEQEHSRMSRQRVSHALLSLIDAEAAFADDKEWEGTHARRNSARLCLSK